MKAHTHFIVKQKISFVISGEDVFFNGFSATSNSVSFDFRFAKASCNWFNKYH